MILPFSHGDMGAAGGDPGGGEIPMDPEHHPDVLMSPVCGGERQIAYIQLNIKRNTMGARVRPINEAKGPG